MAVIKVQALEHESKSLSSKDLLAKLCFYFPQYKYSEARKLPAKDVFNLLKIARQEEARRMHNLTQVISNIGNTKGMDELLGRFKELSDG